MKGEARTAGFLHNQPLVAGAEPWSTPPTRPEMPRGLDRGEHRHTIRSGGTPPIKDQQPVYTDNLTSSQVAVAHSILVAAYWMLKRDEPYHDLGADWHSRRNDQAHTRRLIAQLEHLGHTVIIDPAA